MYVILTFILYQTCARITCRACGDSRRTPMKPMLTIQVKTNIDVFDCLEFGDNVSL